MMLFSKGIWRWCMTMALGLMMGLAIGADVKPVVAPNESPDHSTLTLVTKLANHLQDFQHEDGAISYHLPQAEKEARVVPYFSNIAALGWVEAARVTDDAERRASWLASTRTWLRWYAAHMNEDGSIDDFHGPVGAIKGIGSYDSTDSYAATFGLLAWRYYELTGEKDLMVELAPAMKQARAAINLTRDVDGMTYATPLYGFKYLMDNCEVAIGLAAMDRIFQLVGDAEAAQSCTEQIDQLKSAFSIFYNTKFESFGYAISAYPPALCGFSVPYPDAMANLMVLAWVSDGGPEAEALFDRLWSEFWVANPDSRGFASWWAWAALSCGRPAAYVEARKVLQEQASKDDADCVAVGVGALMTATGNRGLRFPELSIAWPQLTHHEVPAPRVAGAGLPEQTRVVLLGNKIKSPLSHDGRWCGVWRGDYIVPYTMLIGQSYVQVNLVFPAVTDMSACKGLRLSLAAEQQDEFERKMEVTLMEADGDWWSADATAALSGGDELELGLKSFKPNPWGKGGDGKMDLGQMLGVRFSLSCPDHPCQGILTVKQVEWLQ